MSCHVLLQCIYYNLYMLSFDRFEAQGADSLLVAKFDALGLSRAEITLGQADPVAGPF